MPPKKSKPTAESSAKSGAKAEPKSKEAISKQQVPQKRKTGAINGSAEKAARRSGRGSPKQRAPQEQLLKFMLSKDAEVLCRPDDESQDIDSRGNIKTYSGSVMNPFEELLSAVVLSRPISHRLGMRTIRTIFNDPYNFTSAKAVQKAGHEKHLQAVWDARTQHKDKTAEQIGLVADTVLSKFTATGDKDGTQMQKVLSDSDNDVDQALDTLQKEIKGFGATGSKIFLRRVQWLWTSGFPYVDDRTQHSLQKLAFPTEGTDLFGLIEEHWSKLDAKYIAGKSVDEKKRRAFVAVLERAVGADLEGKIDELLDAAARN